MPGPTRKTLPVCWANSGGEFSMPPTAAGAVVAAAADPPKSKTKI